MRLCMIAPELSGSKNVVTASELDSLKSRTD